MLDNCFNPKKLDWIESEGERYLVPEVVKWYRRRKGFCNIANQRRAMGMGKIEKSSQRKYRNIFMWLAQLLIFVNGKLLWADIHGKRR